MPEKESENDDKSEMIRIDKAHFPDKNFRKYIREAFDDDGALYMGNPVAGAQL